MQEQAFKVHEENRLSFAPKASNPLGALEDTKLSTPCPEEADCAQGHRRANKVYANTVTFNLNIRDETS